MAGRSVEEPWWVVPLKVRLVGKCGDPSMVEYVVGPGGRLVGPESDCEL